MHRLATVLVLVALVAAFAVPSSAQCFVDDGFRVPGACCVPVTPNLPNFPAMTIPSDGACFLNCALEATYPVNIIVGAPIQLGCDLFAISLTVTGTVNTATTFFVAKYQRTWEESDPTGIGNRQVWRFLINGDVIYQGITATQVPCPVPATAPNMPVHFYGHLDYAMDCFSPVANWQAAISLTHLCGQYMHHPFSARPLVVNPNPDRIYAMVGPAPFDFTSGAAPQGTVVGDAVRSTAASLLGGISWTCFSELPVLQGNLATLTQGCSCGPNGIPRWEYQDLNFIYGCGTAAANAYQSIPWGPLAPTGLSGFPLGTYVGPAGSFPSGEAVTVYFGIAQAPDPCANNFPLHVVTGIGTKGGTPAMIQQFGTVMFSDQLVDLENTLVFTAAPPHMQIGWGATYLSTMTFGLFLL